MDEDTKMMLEKVLSSGTFRDVYQVMNIFEDELKKGTEDGTQTIS